MSTYPYQSPKMQLAVLGKRYMPVGSGGAWSGYQIGLLKFSDDINHLESRNNYSATSNNMKLVH